MRKSDTPVIAYENVDVSYDGVNNVVTNLSLKLYEGEFVALLGSNGSGKSTIAKLSNAILLPSSGTVTSYGMDTKDESKLLDIRRRVGMVFQNPDNQIVATTVEEDTAFALENLGVEPVMIRERVKQALESVGMSEYAQHPPHKLSGGQKQRVAIAGVLAMQPLCLVLDEATAMLDPKGRKEILSTVKQLHAAGITVVMVTHYMDEAVQADRIIVLENGAVIADGPPEIVFADEDFLAAHGLDVPIPTKMCNILAENGMPMTDVALNAKQAATLIAQAMAE